MERYQNGILKQKYFQYLVNVPFVSKYDSHIRKQFYFANIPCAFDTETTSTYIGAKNDVKFAFMYEWTFGIMVNEKSFIWYGRTWNEFLDFLEELSTIMRLSDKRLLVCYVHNLGYEFQFMRKFFDWQKTFATDERKIIQARTNFIEFRDSYILSGLSLEKTAKNLTTHKIKKLVGDLNYSLVRNSLTTMSKEELAYCNNDVEILLCYIDEQIKEYKDVRKIPMTNTGRVRNFVRDKCFYTNKNHEKSSAGKFQRYKKLMASLTMNKELYKLAKACFMGGFTHANFLYTGKVMENVHSIDFTSSYPAVMLTELFPMQTPYKVHHKKELFNAIYSKMMYAMFICEFTDIESKYHEMYISKSRCIELEQYKENNGRVFSAKRLLIALTDVDWKIIKKTYKYDSVKFANCYVGLKDYLPKSIIDSILDLYEKKTTLKNVEGMESEYLKSKGMLNSVYGMSVTDIVRDEITYTDKWEKQPADVEDQLEKYNKNGKRFLYYLWGIYVTAYARKNLWTGIINMGTDYIYSDTDSIKFLNYEKHKGYINAYNEQITRKLQSMCNFYKIDFNRCSPKTNKGKTKLIGVWDYEGMYTKFKTLGAKRYLYEQDGKLHLTCAGLSKSQGLEFITKGRTVEQSFAFFNDEMYIPAEYTGKQTHTYIDEQLECDITDFQGNTEHVVSPSSIHLEPCEFTLSLSEQYKAFLKQFVNGYLQKGTKYE